MEDLRSLRERYQKFKELGPLFERARELLAKYGETGNIPIGELENIPAGFHEEDLLSCCYGIEEEDKQTIH